jgi:hypothetical protein
VRPKYETLLLDRNAKIDAETFLKQYVLFEPELGYENANAKTRLP